MGLMLLHGRRRALATLAMIAIAGALGAVSGPVLAQDPRITEAQRAARDWLTLSDAGNAQASYAAASPKFQATMSPEEWANASSKARVPLGAVIQRTLTSTQATTQVPNLPDGTYVLLLYRTNFANRDASETITMERVADGAWRLVGYSIR